MKTHLKIDTTIKDVCEGFEYNELEGKGLFGLAGKLTIQQNINVIIFTLMVKKMLQL